MAHLGVPHCLNLLIVRGLGAQLTKFQIGLSERLIATKKKGSRIPTLKYNHGPECMVKNLNSIPFEGFNGPIAGWHFEENTLSQVPALIQPAPNNSD